MELLRNLRARLAVRWHHLKKRFVVVLTECGSGKRKTSGLAQEYACHLPDLEQLWLVRVGDYLATSHQLTSADWKNEKRTKRTSGLT